MKDIMKKEWAITRDIVKGKREKENIQGVRRKSGERKEVVRERKVGEREGVMRRQ